MLDLSGAIALGFISFAAGFSLGVYYLKHKFEDHVTEIMDFTSDSSNGVDLAETFEEIGEEVVEGGNE